MQSPIEFSLCDLMSSLVTVPKGFLSAWKPAPLRSLCSLTGAIVLAVALTCSPNAAVSEPLVAPYTPDCESLAAHEIPEWFDGAKFGIMIHWGLFSVPGWAETALDPSEWNSPGALIANSPEWYMRNPYAEWYANTIQIDGSEAQAYHRETYGSGFAYEEFRQAYWEPEAWAELFAKVGARYVVLVTKHHDGYLLWPSDVAHPLRSSWSSSHDFVGELCAAVRKHDMRMGLYYSGGIDWTFEPRVITSLWDFIVAQPAQPEYAEYADAHWRELIAKYRPAVLWNDIGYPEAAEPLELFAHYYNTVPDGVINDRWSTLVPGAIHHDFVSEEYHSSSEISEQKFETIRGIGRSFGFNRNEDASDYLSVEELISEFVDVVSKNGNLVLNIGPRPDGTIPSEQIERLEAFGRWLEANGEAYFGSKPWTRAEGSTAGGNAVRFTFGANGVLYATVLGAIKDGVVEIEDVSGNPTHIRLLGSEKALRWLIEGNVLQLVLPDDLPEQPAYAFAISGLD